MYSSKMMNEENTYRYFIMLLKNNLVSEVLCFKQPEMRIPVRLYQFQTLLPLN